MIPRARRTPSAERMDDIHRTVYTSEAFTYDHRRFSSRRGQLHHHYEARAICQLLDPLLDRLVLDSPGGTARLALELARQGAKVVVVDLTPNMLSVGKARAESGAVPIAGWLNANGRALPCLSGAIGTVICIRFLHLLPVAEWGPFLRELARVTKQDGTVIVQLFNPFYGGFWALLGEAVRRIRREPGERFVWPWRIRGLFRDCGLEVKGVRSYWLPGMGLLGTTSTKITDILSDACRLPPLSWIGGHLLVIARPVRASCESDSS